MEMIESIVLGVEIDVVHPRRDIVNQSWFYVSVIFI